MTVQGLLPHWCEWNTIDQAVSVVGILQDVDWKSVFKNNAERVRVKIKCRDTSKIPAGRLFGFQGGMFQLIFTVEQVLTAEEVAAQQQQQHDPADGGAGKGTVAQGGQDKENRGNGASKSTTASQGSSGGSQGSGLGVGRTRTMVEQLESPGAMEEFSASEVYKLLVQKGLVSKSGSFVWDKSPETVGKSVLEEVDSFLCDEHVATSRFEERMELAVRDEETDEDRDWMLMHSLTRSSRVAV